MMTRYPMRLKTALPLLGTNIAVLLGGCATPSENPAPVVYHAPTESISRSASTTYPESNPTAPAVNSGPTGTVLNSGLPGYTTGRVEATTTAPNAPVAVQVPPLPAGTESSWSVQGAPVGNTAEQVVIPLHSEQAVQGGPGDVNLSPNAPGGNPSTSTASGTAPQYVAGRAGENAAAAIASLATLASARDLSEMVHRSVDLADVVVREVLGRGLIGLEAPDGQTFYVRIPDELTAVREGDRINLRGRLEAVPQRLQDLGLAPEVEPVMEGRTVYIRASDIRKVLVPEGSAVR